MTVTFRMSSRIGATADAVMHKMMECAEQEALSKRFGASAVQCKRVEDTERSVRIELTSEDPARKGGGTHRSTLHMAWDPTSHVCRWRREDHTHGDRVRTGGTMRLIDQLDGSCSVEEEGEIEIKLPILGKKIARKIAAALQKRQPEKCRWWEARLRE